jgi:hypothetical protein
MRTFFSKIPDLSSRQVLADVLGVHPATLARAEKAGKLQSTKISTRQIVYQKSDVLNYLLGTHEK